MTHLLVCNEVRQQNDRDTKHSNFDKMKQLITDEKIRINQKHLSSYPITSIVNFVILSNHNNPVIAEQDDRRYCVIRTSRKQPSSYYKALLKTIQTPGFYEALLHFLMIRDISQFDQFEIPITSDKKRLMQQNKNDVQIFVEQSQFTNHTKDVIMDKMKDYLGNINSQLNYNYERNLESWIDTFYEEDENNKGYYVIKEEYKLQPQNQDEI